MVAFWFDEAYFSRGAMVGTEMVHRRPRRRFIVKLAGGKLKGDVKGPNESDKDDVGRSDADVEDSLNDDLQTKKIVDQTRAVRKSHQSYDRHRIRSRFAASAFQDAAGVAALLGAIPEVPTAASWKALELAISMTMEKQQGKVTNNQSGGRFDPDFAALFGDVFEVVEKVAGEALKGGSEYTVLTLYVTIRNLLSRSSRWSTANVTRFSPAYYWK
ncbi:glutamate receptor 7 [Culex quinquefasciatus]|uniref:Glutamate receptor 7 n=1 Tax=Culex quinquefasciatus TaxID=7176 RepID=B0XIF5_CULQU|nr:glutamate receptor 7 [Culex quinquefasciatus]|eukprot:XP_001869427.1 glutamate receptor 7 [Culex quinquefasciatus]